MMRKINLHHFKEIIEGKIVQLATVSKKGKPNCICVEANKVIGNSILITDNQMEITFKNLMKNNKVALVIYNPKKNYAYQFKGIAKYFSSGKYFNLVKKLPANKDFSPKGAILIKVKEIYDLNEVKRVY